MVDFFLNAFEKNGLLHYLNIKICTQARFQIKLPLLWQIQFNYLIQLLRLHLLQKTLPSHFKLKEKKNYVQREFGLTFLSSLLLTVLLQPNKLWGAQPLNCILVTRKRCLFINSFKNKDDNVDFSTAAPLPLGL